MLHVVMKKTLCSSCHTLRMSRFAPNHLPKVFFSAGKKPLKPKDVKPLQRIEIREEDLREVYSRSSGPGGQHVNKTNSKVQLLHMPTGIVVQCQEQRDLSRNRKIARQKLRDELDLIYNGARSKKMKKMAKMQKRKSKARK